MRTGEVAILAVREGLGRDLGLALVPAGDRGAADKLGLAGDTDRVDLVAGGGDDKSPLGIARLGLGVDAPEIGPRIVREGLDVDGRRVAGVAGNGRSLQKLRVAGSRHRVYLVSRRADGERPGVVARLGLRVGAGEGGEAVVREALRADG